MTTVIEAHDGLNQWVVDTDDQCITLVSMAGRPLASLQFHHSEMAGIGAALGDELCVERLREREEHISRLADRLLAAERVVEAARPVLLTGKKTGAYTVSEQVLADAVAAYDARRPMIDLEPGEKMIVVKQVMRERYANGSIIHDRHIRSYVCPLDDATVERLAKVMYESHVRHHWEAWGYSGDSDPNWEYLVGNGKLGYRAAVRDVISALVDGSAS